MSDTNILNLGVIGLGNIWKHQQKALKRLSNKYKIVAVCDTDINKTPDDSKISFYPDYTELLKHNNLDAVLVSTPLDSHFKIAQCVLASKKHLLLEKPATQGMKEFDELGKLAITNEVQFVVAFHSAFAKDLLWFLDNRNTFGKITGFRCNFYDPYFVTPNLPSRFSSLKGSWTDSGVNALSVIAELIKLEDLKVDEALFSRLPAYPGESQATVYFSFQDSSDNRIYRGIIDTNWMLGKNQKKTHLYFDEKSFEIILDHSEQSVSQLDSKSGKYDKLFSENNEKRLENQYIGVFNDFHRSCQNGISNYEKAREIHHLLFDAQWKGASD